MSKGKISTSLGNNSVFRRAEKLENVTNETATIKGLSIKTLILIGVTIVSALFGILIANYMLNFFVVYLTISIVIPLITFILSLIMSFRPDAAKYLSIPYAVLEGLSIGAICGICLIGFGKLGYLMVSLAFILTLSVFLAAIILYFTGLVKVTSFFRKFMYVALLGSLIASIMVSLVFLIGYLSGVMDMNFYQSAFEAGSIVRVFSLIGSFIMIVIASLYVLISLDNATNVVNNGLDKTYEWYAAFGIVINLIWLFYQILRFVVLVLGGSKRK